MNPQHAEFIALVRDGASRTDARLAVYGGDPEDRALAAANGSALASRLAERYGLRLPDLQPLDSPLPLALSIPHREFRDRVRAGESRTDAYIAVYGDMDRKAAARSGSMLCRRIAERYGLDRRTLQPKASRSAWGPHEVEVDRRIEDDEDEVDVEHEDVPAKPGTARFGALSIWAYDDPGWNPLAWVRLDGGEGAIGIGLYIHQAYEMREWLSKFIAWHQSKSLQGGNHGRPE